MDYQKVIDSLEKSFSVYGFKFNLVHAEFTPKVSYYRSHITANYTHKFKDGKFKINRTFVYMEDDDEFRENGCSFSDGTDYYGDAFRLADFEINFLKMITYKEDKIEGSDSYLETYAYKPNVVSVDNPNIVTIMGVDLFNKGKQVEHGSNPKSTKIEYKNKKERPRRSTIILSREFDENGVETKCHFTFFYHGRYHGSHYESHDGKNIYEIFDFIKDLNNRVISGKKRLQKSLDYLAIDREKLKDNFAKHLMTNRGFTRDYVYGVDIELVDATLEVIDGVRVNTNVFRSNKDSRVNLSKTEIFHDCESVKTIYEIDVDGEEKISSEIVEDFRDEMVKRLLWYKEKLGPKHSFVTCLDRVASFPKYKNK